MIFPNLFRNDSKIRPVDSYFKYSIPMRRERLEQYEEREGGVG